jgi:hypothetical protein
MQSEVESCLIMWHALAWKVWGQPVCVVTSRKHIFIFNRSHSILFFAENSEMDDFELEVRMTRGCLPFLHSDDF